MIVTEEEYSLILEVMRNYSYLIEKESSLLKWMVHNNQDVSINQIKLVECVNCYKQIKNIKFQEVISKELK